MLTELIHPWIRQRRINVSATMSIIGIPVDSGNKLKSSKFQSGNEVVFKVRTPQRSDSIQIATQIHTRTSFLYKTHRNSYTLSPNQYIVTQSINPFHFPYTELHRYFHSNILYKHNAAAIPFLSGREYSGSTFNAHP